MTSKKSSQWKNQERRRKVAFSLSGVNTTTGHKIKVAVFEPERDDEDRADPRPAMEEAAKKCWALISTDTGAKNVTQDLLNKGCDWVQLLAHVERYCEAREARWKELQKEFSKYLRGLSRKILRFDSRVEQWEVTLRKFNEEIEQLTHVDLSPHTPSFEAYRAALRVAQVNALPSGKKQKIEHECVTYLYHLLDVCTGKPRFKEVADLLQARLDCDKSTRGVEPIDVETLHDIIKSFKESEWPRYNSLRQGVKFGLRFIPPSWRKLPSV